MGNETKFHHNVTIPDPQARRLVIPNLVKGMAYKIQVAAYNRKGVGVLSDPKYLGELEGSPGRYPVINRSCTH